MSYLFKSNTSDFLVLRLMNLLPPDSSVEFCFHSWEEAACNHILCFSNSTEWQKFLPPGSRKRLQVEGNWNLLLCLLCLIFSGPSQHRWKKNKPQFEKENKKPHWIQRKPPVWKFTGEDWWSLFLEACPSLTSGWSLSCLTRDLRPAAQLSLLCEFDMWRKKLMDHIFVPAG